MIENPMLSPRKVEDPIAKPIGKCHYRHCDEVIFKGEGYEFDNYIYCSFGCIGNHGLEEGWVREI